jgi:hypothetical protein
MDDGRLEDVKTRGREDVSEGTDAAARRSEPFGGTPKGTRGIRLRSEATAGQARVLPGIGALGRLHAAMDAQPGRGGFGETAFPRGVLPHGAFARGQGTPYLRKGAGQGQSGLVRVKIMKLLVRANPHTSGEFGPFDALPTASRQYSRLQACATGMRRMKAMPSERKKRDFYANCAIGLSTWLLHCLLVATFDASLAENPLHIAP